MADGQPPLPKVEATTLERFLEDVGSRAYRFAELGLRNRDDALDAVQDAMLRMLRYRDRPVAEWRPLFWRILRSRIIDLQRRRSFRNLWQHSSADPADAEIIAWKERDTGFPDPSREHDGQEAWGRIVQAMRTLPARQREAFTLRVLEELDVATTAAIMGVSEGSVKTHLSRAREALKGHLKDWA